MASLSWGRATSRSIERIALRVTVLLIPLVAFWWVAAPTYSDVIFRVSQVAFHADPTMDAAIGKDEAGIPTVYNLSRGIEQPVFRFDRVGLFFNTIVLLTLMLVVPGWNWPKRAVRLALALGLLGLTHVGFVVLQAKAQFINLGLSQASEGVAYLVNWLAVLFGPIGEGLFPLAIAFGLSWSAWADAFNLRLGFRRTSTAVGRNAPCPCGSGRKHKRCCGQS